jgi:hypothetical protein
MNFYFDGHNDLDLNTKITNIFSQLRTENNGPYQCLTLTLLE